MATSRAPITTKTSTPTNRPPAAAAAGAKPNGKPTYPPNQTLYITNLPPKLPKPALRMLLYTLFATYGVVLDVNCMRSAGGASEAGAKTKGNKTMRGQAHVAMRDVQSAREAMRALQGFGLCGGGGREREGMNIQYAKGKSDVVAKLDGTWRMPSSLGAGGGGGGEGKGTDLQKEVFGGVPGRGTTAATVPAAVGRVDGRMDVDGGEGPKGVKRGREEDDDEEDDKKEGGGEEDGSDEGAPMEQDSDEDAPMEEDSDDD